MPQKSEKTADDPSAPRRSFLTKLWIFLGVVAILEIIGLVIAFLRPRKPRSENIDAEALVIAGPVDNFAYDSVTAFVRGQFYLSRFADGGFLALSRKCTHLGCTVPWVASEKAFACPCHSSVFDIKGAVISSPASRPLDIHPIIIENRIIKVDTSKRLKRSEFNVKQVTYEKKKT
jgi:cytochrome b6-f complex iron-sulfur subunit